MLKVGDLVKYVYYDEPNLGVIFEINQRTKTALTICWLIINTSILQIRRTYAFAYLTKVN